MTRQYPDHIDIVHLHAREASDAERLRSSRLVGSDSDCLGLRGNSDIMRLGKSCVSSRVSVSI